MLYSFYFLETLYRIVVFFTIVFLQDKIAMSTLVTLNFMSTFQSKYVQVLLPSQIIIVPSMATVPELEQIDKIK